MTPTTNDEDFRHCSKTIIIIVIIFDIQIKNAKTDRVSILASTHSTSELVLICNAKSKV